MKAKNESAIEKVKEVIASVAGRDKQELNPGTSLIHDLELDSLALYEIVIELEELYDLRISDEDIERIQTIGEAAAYINQRLDAEIREV